MSREFASYLQNTPSTAYKWARDNTANRTNHHDVTDTIDNSAFIRDEINSSRMDRVNRLAQILDDIQRTPGRKSSTSDSALLRDDKSERSSCTLLPHRANSAPTERRKPIDHSSPIHLGSLQWKDMSSSPPISLVVKNDRSYMEPPHEQSSSLTAPTSPSISYRDLEKTRSSYQQPNTSTLTNQATLAPTRRASLSVSSNGLSWTSDLIKEHLADLLRTTESDDEYQKQPTPKPKSTGIESIGPRKSKHLDNTALDRDISNGSKSNFEVISQAFSSPRKQHTYERPLIEIDVDEDSGRTSYFTQPVHSPQSIRNLERTSATPWSKPIQEQTFHSKANATQGSLSPASILSLHEPESMNHQTPRKDPRDEELLLMTSTLEKLSVECERRGRLIDELVDDVKQLSSSPPRVTRDEKLEKELADARREISALKKLTRELTELVSSPRPPEPLHTRDKIRPLEAQTPVRFNESETIEEKMNRWETYLETPVFKSKTPLKENKPFHQEPSCTPRPNPNSLPLHKEHTKCTTNAQIPPKEPQNRMETDIERLKAALRQAQEEIDVLRNLSGHAQHVKALTPQMMPGTAVYALQLTADSKDHSIPREEKVYYRLQLYKIDRLCSNETANLLKNILIQMDIPLDVLPQRIMEAREQYSEIKRLKRFAEDVHGLLYHGEKMRGVDKKCLGEMIGRLGKLVKGEERRRYQSRRSVVV